MAYDLKVEFSHSDFVVVSLVPFASYANLWPTIHVAINVVNAASAGSTTCDACLNPPHVKCHEHWKQSLPQGHAVVTTTEPTEITKHWVGIVLYSCVRGSINSQRNHKLKRSC